MYAPLLRPRHNRKIAGVCAAFARAYAWDLNLVRLVLVLLVLFGGGGILAYVICWIVIPEDPVSVPSYPPAYGAGAQPPYPAAGAPPYPPAGAAQYPPSEPPPTA